MRFTKMHGIGNDYVYIDCLRQPIPADPAALARAVSPRNFAIGADGLILICPSTKADARMRMFNADGSEAEMCGNGLRCVAKFIYDHGIARKPKLAIETGRGILTVDVKVKNDKVSHVTVNMGEPILKSAEIPTTLPGDPPVNAPLRIGSVIFNATCVSMGNPHCVIFEEKPEDKLLDEADYDVVRECGPLIETDSHFPQRTNVHFVKVHSPAEVTMRTWERGSGITLACGTGACAVCVAGVLNGRTGRKILAHLPGGDLELEWSAADNCVSMTGPATEVFSGEWPE